LLSLPLSALAGLDTTVAHRRHARVEARNATHARRGVTYKLEDDFSGDSFFDNFNFFTGSDPTSGLVDFVDSQTAKNDGLAVVQSDQTIMIYVDSTTQLSSGQNRKSVRITSNKQYNSGLFIADFFAMPHGCSVWPAYWTVGPDWPNGGEMDIIEGVNLNTDNQITLHTGPTCVISNAAAALGNLVGTQCTSSNGNNAGCAFTQSGGNSFGHGFNMQGGGVFAHNWDSSGISVWFFPRQSIPQDITDGNPDPSSWGAPIALFPNNDSCDTTQRFHDHSIVIDTTLCGDWAGAAYGNDGCPGSCADFVADPKNFVDAHWAIASIKVYQAN